MAPIDDSTLSAGALAARRRLSALGRELPGRPSPSKDNPDLSMVTGLLVLLERSQLARPRTVPVHHPIPTSSSPLPFPFSRLSPPLKDSCCCAPRLAPFSSRPSVRPLRPPARLWELTWLAACHPARAASRPFAHGPPSKLAISVP